MLRRFRNVGLGSVFGFRLYLILKNCTMFTATKFNTESELEPKSWFGKGSWIADDAEAYRQG